MGYLLIFSVFLVAASAQTDFSNSRVTILSYVASSVMFQNSDGVTYQATITQNVDGVSSQLTVINDLSANSNLVIHDNVTLYKICIPAGQQSLCQSLDKDGSRVVCESVESRVDCALKLARGTADLGVFSEDEVLLLAQQQPTDHRVVASVRSVGRFDPYAFEAVAVVPNAHTNGFEGLRNGKYCHPGLDEMDRRWSPRVLRTLEHLAAKSNQFPEHETNGRTAEELEVEALSRFFSAGCRPGSWSINTNTDSNLKRDHAKLCQLCGDTNPTCSGYTFDMGVAISGISNTNRHIQALECMARNGQNTVAFVAWQHVREFFTTRSPQLVGNYSLLCEDGTLRPLTAAFLTSVTAPCSLVKQPYPAIVATQARAATILSELRTWWPNGLSPGGNVWQATLYDVLVGGPGLRASFEDTLPTPANFSDFRNLPSVDSAATFMPIRRWCTVSAQENTKCSWVRRAAHTLGIQPAISCQQRQSVFQCLEDIRDSRSDFISLDSNYGFLARQSYKLSPVKLLQNSRSNVNSFSRIAAVVKETTAQSNVTRFENLRGKTACFPEFGGIAYVTFVRTAHERGIISASECDYARAVGEFFTGACAPGAVDAAHSLYAGSSFNASTLCTACRTATSSSVVQVGTQDFTCAYDYTNMYFGNNGSLACLADANTDVAFLETQNIDAQLQALNLQAANYRVLCRNNSLALTTGLTVDDNCLLALVVDAEVLARRNDPQSNSLSSLLDLLDLYFGYNAAAATQLINLEIYSPFDGVSDLLFKDSAIGLSEPSSTATNEPARNYFELFQHLESCTGGAPGLASNVYPLIMMVLMTAMSLFVIY